MTSRRIVLVVLLLGALGALLALPADEQAEPDAWNEPRLMQEFAGLGLGASSEPACAWSWLDNPSKVQEGLRRLLTWPIEALQSTEADELAALAGPDPVFVTDTHCLVQPGHLTQKIVRFRRDRGQRTLLLLTLISEDMQSKVDGLMPFDRNRKELRACLEKWSPYPVDAYPEMMSLATRVLAGRPTDVAPTTRDGFRKMGRFIDKRLRSHRNLVLLVAAYHVLAEEDRGFSYPPNTQIVVVGLATWEVAIRRRLKEPPPGPLRLSPTTVFFPVSDTGLLARAMRGWPDADPQAPLIESLRSPDVETRLGGLRKLAACLPWERALHAPALTKALQHPDARVHDAALDAILGLYRRYDIPSRLAAVLVTATKTLSGSRRARAADLLAQVDLFDPRDVAAIRELSAQAALEDRHSDLLRLSVALAASLYCDATDIANYRRCFVHFGDAKELNPLIQRLGSCGPLAASLLVDLAKLAIESESPVVRHSASRAARRIRHDLELIREARDSTK